MERQEGLGTIHSAAMVEADNELVPLLNALRTRGDEAQFTQVIAGVARADPAFGRNLAKLLVEAAPKVGPAPQVPEKLECRAERRLSDDAGAGVGRVDLIFEDREGTFTLLVELKLDSGYGHRQLDRYLSSLNAFPGGQKWLLAVTKSAPHIGEEEAATDPRWLGSVRWADIFDSLRTLAIDRPLLAQGWRAIGVTP